MKTAFNLNFYKDHYLDLFLPDNDEFITVIHFHGGGLVEGDKGDTHKYCEHLAKAGFAVATANYSLLPDHKFPEFIYDAAHAVKYVVDNIAKYGKSKGFIISGQSAGAYITLMLCFNKEYLKSVNVDDDQIIGWLSDSGQPTSHFNILNIEKGLHSMVQRIDETAPLYYVNEGTYFSSLILAVYEDDIPNRLEQNRLLYSTIKYFNNNAQVYLHVLDGGHCRASSEVDKDGEYTLVKLMKAWREML